MAECDMRYEPPFDFAWCETHDETFPLGQVCRFHPDHEPGDLEGYCRGCGDPASKHEGSFCMAHYSADLVQGDAKLRGNSGDADANQDHENGVAS